MKSNKLFILSLAILSSLISISSFAEEIPSQDDTVLYAQQSFYAEKGVNFGTNYGTGTCYPVNTKFKVIGINQRVFGAGDTMKIVNIDTGTQIEIRNVEKYTHLSIEKLRDRMFAQTTVDLLGRTPAVKEAISSCEVIKGMTREEVLLARGYPPVHETPSLEQDIWSYWYQRMSKGSVRFKDGKVVAIEGSIQPRTVY